MAEGRVAVVGAGLAGIAAALELKSLGHTVDIFERSRLLGGKATSFEIDGIEVDNGQHVFLACCHELIEFLNDLGLMSTTAGRAGTETSSEILDSAERPPGSTPAVYLQPRFEALLLSRTHSPVRLHASDLPAPLHLLPALLSANHLGLFGRLQAAVGLIQAGGWAYPQETFDQWLRRHKQSSRVIEGFWKPFVVPALNATAKEVSADDALFVIRTAFLDDREAARFGYSRVPLGRIAKLAASRVDRVRLRTPVMGLELNGSGACRLKGVRVKGDTVLPYDGVVLAIPPPRLKQLLGRPVNLGVFGLDQFRFASIVDVHLWFDAQPGTLLENRFAFAALLHSPVQWVFEKPAPPGETYLCCSMSAATNYVGRSTEDLTKLCHEELKAVLPAIRQVGLLRAAATRDREATFIPFVGLIRPGPRTTCPQVVLAGAWTDTGWPATMESAVRSGKRAAQVLHGANAA